MRFEKRAKYGKGGVPFNWQSSALPRYPHRDWPAGLLEKLLASRPEQAIVTLAWRNENEINKTANTPAQIVYIELHRNQDF